MRIATAHASRGVIFALTLSLVASAVPVAAFAVPGTPEIAAKQAEAATAQAQLEEMNALLEVQIEEYNAITESLDRTREEIRATQSVLECARADLAQAQETLASRATNIYKDGGTNALEVFLGARSFDDFLMLLELAVRISRSDAAAVAGVKDAKARVEATALALEQRQAEQITLQSEAKMRAEKIESDVAAQDRFVSQLNAEVRTLIAAEEERQRKLAEERARQAAFAAAARSASSSAADRSAADPSALGAGHPEVIAIALEYVGVPYAWGGSSPSGFDCSGFTQYCYRQVGISLPRTSQSQYQSGQHIARDRLDLLKPGDLVFFGTDGDADQVHHVGMYVGDGNYIHAPYTGATVRVDSLTARITSRADYVGASRL